MLGRCCCQIYVPQVNWLLLIAFLALVLGFQSSSVLASAYGFAVTGTMTNTTILAAAVMRGVWRWQWPTIAVVLECLGGIQIDEELEFGRLLHGQIRRLRSP
jgi:K+ transporter